MRIRTFVTPGVAFALLAVSGIALAVADESVSSDADEVATEQDPFTPLRDRARDGTCYPDVGYPCEPIRDRLRERDPAGPDALAEEQVGGREQERQQVRDQEGTARRDRNRDRDQARDGTCDPEGEHVQSRARQRDQHQQRSQQRSPAS